MPSPPTRRSVSDNVRGDAGRRKERAAYGMLKMLVADENGLAGVFRFEPV